MGALAQDRVVVYLIDQAAERRAVAALGGRQIADYALQQRLHPHAKLGGTKTDGGELPLAAGIGYGLHQKLAGNRFIRQIQFCDRIVQVGS
ncbi:Uncharacterised protein [uncultured Ruminococcus sp.]|nr:Uncharacterised protein [uncultured Ruminococcus sp.]